MSVTDIPQGIKIGLALGSGAARGWAHIGVIQALEEMGIKPHVITGCSIGSLVGAAYAANKLDALETWARDLSSWDVFNLMDITLNKGGLVAGERVFDAAEAELGLDTIEQLHLPFACVATELQTGKEIWLKQGRVRDVVRASCAIPGLMAPFRLDGQWLVDGAVVNPVPVNLCRALGADVVIAVNLNFDQRARNLTSLPTLDDNENNRDQGFWQLLGGGKDFINSIVQRIKADMLYRPPSMVGVMSASINIMQERLTRARMAGDPPEILLNPRLRDIGIMDFHCAEECIAEGLRITRLMQPAIFESLNLPYNASLE